MPVDTIDWMVAVATSTLLRELGITDASEAERMEARQLARTVLGDAFASLESPAGLANDLPAILREVAAVVASAPETATSDQLAVVAEAVKVVLSAVSPKQPSTRTAVDQLSLLDRVTGPKTGALL